jgi:hypothetical protein
MSGGAQIQLRILNGYLLRTPASNSNSELGASDRWQLLLCGWRRVYFSLLPLWLTESY